MTAFADIESRAGAEYLAILGGFHPDGDPHLPDGTRTLLLIGPQAPGFWPHFHASSEYADGDPDPMDRWSTRVIGALADATGAAALFPFGGPPFLPFIGWAQATGRIHKSPVSLLVHDEQGLMTSFRGALAFPDRLDLPPPPITPCLICAAPCEDACPVDALTEDGYDTAACHAFLDTPAGADCMDNGCKVRRACPVSKSHGRDPAQSAFHMRSFHP
ncbi:ferredoxin [Hasllibacter sp. MH4015]|uniref:ferredoxin n=1 Tax=Hasllibacter sp. MH4015 TaxID=2854029 RepID=UPI001CD6B363|nr:ferredoxin [Hasllibacter sp. MH4015]